MFEVAARLKIRDGELEGFKKQAVEIMRLARQKDTKPLRYDWFLNDSTGTRRPPPRPSGRGRACPGWCSLGSRP
jgi:hypothetical protein